MVSREPPLTQHRQDQEAGGGFQETEQRTHTPITIDKTPVEQVKSFKFLGVHITEDLTWSAHTDAVLKKAHQRLFFLRWLRRFGMSPSILISHILRSNAVKAGLLKSSKTQLTPVTIFSVYCHLASASGA